MDSNDLLKKVRKIEIKTRALSSQIFAGEYHSAFKGRGMAFSEVREYQIGDDVRNMDWNVTARTGTPYIKVFEEERELTVMLLIDASGSGWFGTSSKTKKDLTAEIAAVLSFSASINNDKVGALFFSTRVEKFIPPEGPQPPAEDHPRGPGVPPGGEGHGHRGSPPLPDQRPEEEVHGIPALRHARHRPADLPSPLRGCSEGGGEPARPVGDQYLRREGPHPARRGPSPGKGQ